MKQNNKTGIYIRKLEKSQEYSNVNIIKNKHGKDLIMQSFGKDGKNTWKNL